MGSLAGSYHQVGVSGTDVLVVKSGESDEVVSNCLFGCWSSNPYKAMWR